MCYISRMLLGLFSALQRDLAEWIPLKTNESVLLTPAPANEDPKKESYDSHTTLYWWVAVTKIPFFMQLLAASSRFRTVSIKCFRVFQLYALPRPQNQNQNPVSSKHAGVKTLWSLG